MTSPTERKPQLRRFRFPVLLVATAVLLVAARGLDVLVAGVPVLRLLVGAGAAAGAVLAYTGVTRWVEGRDEVGELAAAGRWVALGAGHSSVPPPSSRPCSSRSSSPTPTSSVVVSSLFFGLTHLINGNATLWGALAIAVEGGAMLAVAYTVTQSLWLPIGLHFAWNFLQGGVFGTAVSGAAAEPGLLRTVLSGPEALTGGSFGPEAGLFALLCCGVVTALLLRRAKLIPRR
jgi:hypothetical protein